MKKSMLGVLVLVLALPSFAAGAREGRQPDDIIQLKTGSILVELRRQEQTFPIRIP